MRNSPSPELTAHLAKLFTPPTPTQIMDGTTLAAPVLVEAPLIGNEGHQIDAPSNELRAVLWTLAEAVQRASAESPCPFCGVSKRPGLEPHHAGCPVDLAIAVRQRYHLFEYPPADGD